MPKLSYKRYEELRDNAGWTNSYVARKIGVSPQCIGYWKNGKRTPKVDKIIAIAKLFNKPLDYFYVNEEE